MTSNRMVHFYHEVSQEELYQLCTRNMEDIEVLLETLAGWLRESSREDGSEGVMQSKNKSPYFLFFIQQEEL